MNKLAALAFALVAGAGCYASGYGYGSTGYVSTGSTVAYGGYSTPPPEVVVDTNLYYEPRPGYVYVNGRYNWLDGAWAWQNGYYMPERPGQVYVQGYWNGNRWNDGYWAGARAGYTYTGGYWDRRGRSHVWVPGNWERNRNDGSVYVHGRWSTNGGARTYTRGGWVRGGGHVRGGGQVRGGGGIRDHRR